MQLPQIKICRCSKISDTGCSHIGDQAIQYNMPEFRGFVIRSFNSARTYINIRNALPGFE